MNLPSMTMMDNLEGPGMILCDGSWQAGVRSEWEVQQDDSSSSEQIHSGLPVSGAKRKATSGGKPSCTGGENKLANTETKSVVKAERTTSEQSGDSKVHPKQDFIHVRARRGQATDSHSLAERVRREKISERMKFLQDLVPGCSKVTGKAVMLDEIINYVQSLQRQIEFLSMKLAAIDPRLDTNLENLLNREVIQESSLMGPDLFSGHRDNYQSHVQLQQQLIDRNMDLRNVGTLCDAYIRRSMQNNSPAAPPALAAYTDSFVDSLAQTISEVSDGDLQTIVRMGNVTQARHDFFGQDGVHGPGFLPTGHLKVEY